MVTWSLIGEQVISRLSRKGSDIVINYTLQEWVNEWLYTYKRIMVKPSTFDSYLQYATNISCNKFISELETADIQSMINKMVVEGKQLSTIKHMLTVTRQSLYKAKALGLIKHLDCFDNLELPKAAPKKVGALSSEQVKMIFNNAYKSYFGDFYCALLLTGCRVGELIALTWHDVDWFNDCIYITKTDYNGELQSVKTANGVRSIPLYGKLKELLSARYREDKGTSRVFLNTLGRPIVYRTLLDDWHWFCKSIGLWEPLGFHVLRHTFAHVALRNAVPIKVVSSWLGHSDVRITLNIYDSVDVADMKRAAERLDLAFEA